jgi:stringent starvation protein B
MLPRSQEKKQTLLAFLKRGVAMLHLDARQPGVSVPSQHAGDAHLRLNLSYRYSIRDFEVRDEGVQATLSFGGQAFFCVLPWESVFAVTSSGTGEGQVWPEDLPTEAERGFASQKPSEERPRTQLAAVEDEEFEPAPPERPREPAGGPKRGGHLRLVR